MLKNSTHIVDVYKSIMKFKTLSDEIIQLVKTDKIDKEIKLDTDIILEVLLIQHQELNEKLVYSLLWLEKNKKNELLNYLLKKVEDEKSFCSLFKDRLDTTENCTKLALSLAEIDAYIQYLEDGTEMLMTNIKPLKDLKVVRDNLKLDSEKIFNLKKNVVTNNDKMKFVSHLSSLPSAVLSLELYTIYEYIMMEKEK